MASSPSRAARGRVAGNPAARRPLPSSVTLTIAALTSCPLGGRAADSGSRQCQDPYLDNAKIGEMSRCAVAYHHGDLPAALLIAVEQAVTDRGVSALSLRDVARRAGVSHGAPAHHFGSKAGLLTAFAIQGHRLLAQTIAEEMASLGAADPAAEVAAMGQGYVRFAIARPAHFAVMYRHDALLPGDRELAAARDRLYQLLDGAIERARAQGRLRGHPPQIAVISAWSLAHGLAALWTSGRLAERTGEHDPQAIATAVTNLFTQAIMPPPPPAPGHAVSPPSQPVRPRPPA
jgi:AcrR family transcriptional regulator